MLRAAVTAADRDDPRQLQLAGAASMFTGDEQTAAELLTRAMARARAIGAVSRLPETLATLASLEVWSGELATARAHAVEGADWRRRRGRSTSSPTSTRPGLDRRRPGPGRRVPAARR